MKVRKIIGIIDFKPFRKNLLEPLNKTQAYLNSKFNDIMKPSNLFNSGRELTFGVQLYSFNSPELGISFNNGQCSITKLIKNKEELEGFYFIFEELIKDLKEDTKLEQFYFGFICEVFVGERNDINFEKYTKLKIISDTNVFYQRYGFIKEDNYYLTFDFFNDVKMNSNVNLNQLYNKPDFIKPLNESVIGTIDINDKAGFLFNKHYSTSNETMKILWEKMIYYINQGLESFLKEE